MSRPRQPFETCPSCGEQDSICLMYGPYIKLDGTPGRDRLPAFCNNTRCDQRYWYYPRHASGAYVTRRNTGVTYQEWQYAPCHQEGLPSVQIAVASVGEAGPEQILGERTVYAWYHWLRAAVLSMFKRGKTND